MVGLGFTAYLFGLRHAFDADHIAAIDDTVRYLLQQGKRALGVGFFSRLATPPLSSASRSPLLAQPLQSRASYRSCRT